MMQVMKKVIIENQTKINADSLKEGVYYLRLSDGKNVVNKKMIIEK